MMPCPDTNEIGHWGASMCGRGGAVIATIPDRRQSLPLAFPARDREREYRPDVSEHVRIEIG